jgi:hypothetical protein
MNPQRTSAADTTNVHPRFPPREPEERETMSVPKNYRSIEEFEREELRPQFKVGFSLDDLIQETAFDGSDLLFDDTKDEYDPDQGEDED